MSSQRLLLSLFIGIKCKEMLSSDGERLAWRTVNKGAVGFDTNVVEMVKYGHENES